MTWPASPTPGSSAEPDELRRQAGDAADDEARCRSSRGRRRRCRRRAAHRLLADAAEHGLEVERLVERLRRAGERELALHVRSWALARARRRRARVAAAAANSSPSGPSVSARAPRSSRTRRRRRASELAGGVRRRRAQRGQGGGVRSERGGRARRPARRARAARRRAARRERSPPRVATARARRSASSSATQHARRRAPKNRAPLRARPSSHGRGVGGASRGAQQAGHGENGVGRAASAEDPRLASMLPSRPSALSLYTGRARRAGEARFPERWPSG